MDRERGIETGRAETIPRISLRKNILANYLGRAYSLGASYLFIPFYIKILGIESFGVIAFYALLLAITSIADVGLSATFSRQAAREGDPAKLAGMLGTAERILLLAVACCALGIFFAAGWVVEHWLRSSSSLASSEMVWSLRFMALMLVPQLLITLYSAGLLGLQHQVAANVIQALFVTVRAGLVILVILWRPDLTLFFGWQAAFTLVFAVITRTALLQRMGVERSSALTFEWAVLRPHLKYAAGVVVITAISTINTQLDKILISRLFTIAEFGYYNVASTLAQLPIAVAMPIVVAFFPRLTASVANSGVGLQSTFGTYLRLVSFVAATGALGLALFASEILQIWLQSGVPALLPQLVATLAVGSFLLCINAPSYYLCLAHGRSWLVVGVSLATLAVSLPSLLIGMHLYGLWGAALAWLILNFVNFVLLTAATQVAGLGLSIVAILRGMMGPIAIAAVPLLASRWIASGLGLGPLASSLVAAGAGTVALIGFAMHYRMRLAAIERPL
jgi:O-antigen/teichoic acid export membrane protein